MILGGTGEVRKLNSGRSGRQCWGFKVCRVWRGLTGFSLAGFEPHPHRAFGAEGDFFFGDGWGGVQVGHAVADAKTISVYLRFG